MLFEVVDKNGKKIRLTQTGWSHIQIEHPEVSIQEIKSALEYPTKITTSIYDNKVKWYYRFNKALGEYNGFSKVLKR